MKALKTPLARQLLSDPEARKQLRDFLHTRTSGDRDSGRTIEFIGDGNTVQVVPKIVPRAA